jgi:hypothetical protein
VPNRIYRFFVHAALALALLVAQAGALVHAASHEGNAHHGGLPHAQVCGQCLSFSTVLSVAGGSGIRPVLPVASCAALIKSADTGFHSASTPRPFWSRGPPASR